MAVQIDAVNVSQGARTYAGLTDDRDPKIAEKAAREHHDATRKALTEFASRLETTNARVCAIEEDRRKLNHALIKITTLGHAQSQTIAKLEARIESLTEHDDRLAAELLEHRGIIAENGLAELVNNPIPLLSLPS